MQLKNRNAFLYMLAISEGTQQIGSNNGYDVIVGSTKSHPNLITNYTDHPRVVVKLGKKLKSTAAGRYQIKASIYDAYKKQLNLKGFYPEDQDAIAYQLISECNALHLIDAGNFKQAVFACRSRWASLPGANYGQHINNIELLIAAYSKAGGLIA